MACTVDPARQTESDILVATELNGKVADNNPVSLTFDHVMSKVNVELSFRNQWGGTPEAPVTPTVESVQLGNVATDGTVNYLTKTVTPGTARAAMVLPQTRANTVYSSVLIPQTGINTVVIRIDGKDFTYTHSSDFTFGKGKYTTIKLIVGRNQIDLGDVTINGWGKGDEIRHRLQQGFCPRGALRPCGPRRPGGGPADQGILHHGNPQGIRPLHP